MYSVNLFFIYSMALSYYIMLSCAKHFKSFSPILYPISGILELMFLIAKKIYYKREIFSEELGSATLSFIFSLIFGLLWHLTRNFIKNKESEDRNKIVNDEEFDIFKYENMDFKKSNILDLSLINEDNQKEENKKIYSEEEILGLKTKITEDHIKIDEMKMKISKQEEILNKKLESMTNEIIKFEERIKAMSESENKELRQTIDVIATQNACLQEKVLELKKKSNQIDYLEEKLGIIETKVDTNIDEVQDFVNKISGLIEVIDIGIKRKHLLDI